MHQSPVKAPPRRRDRQADLDAIEFESERRAYRAPAPKARRSGWRDEAPAAQRWERSGR
jgi:hypothetical protein